MMFSYSVPARRFYAGSAIDHQSPRYEADRSLVDNVRLLARAEWGPVSAARATALAEALVAGDPGAARAPWARQWVGAILYAVAHDTSPRTLAVIETQTGASPVETLARHAELSVAPAA